MFLLTLCAVYVCAGLSAFVAFLMLGNYVGALWAGVTGIISAINTHLHWLKLKNYVRQWYDQKELKPIARMGFAFFAIGMSGIAYHTTVEVLSKKPFLPVNQSEVICIVWAFMTAKSGLFLMHTARSFCKVGDQEICQNTNIVQSI
ncbi:hypothetical protein FQR65_LT08958 [Abscondita terminalis]|nr:hypothetical protein FQR65_LT08958 [Abscondita terminalis]